MAGSITPTMLMALTVAAAGFSARAGFRMERAIQRTLLRTELRRRGIPVCIACGYEGGDINAPKCPECGAATSS